MISGKQNLIAWFIENKMPYFSILKLQDKLSGNVFFSNTDKEAQTFESALHDFEKALSFISTGQFICYADDQQKIGSKGRKQAEFSISFSDTTPTAPAPQISGTGGGLSYEEVERKAEQIADARFERLMDKRELQTAKEKLAETEKELNEYKRKADSRWDKVIDGIAPYIPNVISGIFPQAGPAIGNIPKEDTEVNDNTPAVELTQEQMEQMSGVVNIFCEHLATRYPVKDNPEPGYKNWLQVLHQLTRTLQNQPEKIDMALKFL